jgi:hypothetical protein
MEINSFFVYAKEIKEIKGKRKTIIFRGGLGWGFGGWCWRCMGGEGCCIACRGR